MFLSKITGLSAQAPCRRPLPGVFLVMALTAPSSVPPLTISLLFKQSRLPSLWVRNSSSAHTAPPLHATAAEAFPPSGRGAPFTGHSLKTKSSSANERGHGHEAFLPMHQQTQRAKGGPRTWEPACPFGGSWRGRGLSLRRIPGTSGASGLVSGVHTWL